MHQEITIIGNLGQNPRLSEHNGTPVANLTVAANRRFQTAQGRVDETTWFNVAVWGNQANAVSEYLKSGSQVYVQGRLVPNPDGRPKVFQRPDGEYAASFDVNARVIRFLGRPSNGAVQETEVDFDEDSEDDSEE